MDRRARRTRRVVAEINVVPYIDVMLVLLVIFMVTAPMLQQGVEVTPPSAASKALPPEDDLPVIITVNKAGEYFVSNAEDPKSSLPLSEVRILVEAALRDKPKIQVLVKGSGEANYNAVMQAMIIAQQAGVEKVGLVTNPSGNTAPSGGK
ncbi:protein TolR [Halothiobacillus sp.]|uniref:protein TolR n=1 Tax=Halothiobacillus sp. TaxID=1891311 RepID=UPI00262BA0D5|nr:protein TolR [Halothiobacillus sp.]